MAKLKSKSEWVALIAREFLHLPSLIPTNTGHDFREQGVISVKAALEAAYEAGKIAGQKEEIDKTIAQLKMIVPPLSDPDRHDVFAD